MSKNQIVFGNESHFKNAPTWANHVVQYNNTKYFTENAHPKPFDKFARFHEPHVQGNLNEHMFKSSEYSFFIVASRINIYENAWDGKGEPLTGQICSFASPIQQYKAGTPVVVSGILNLFHGRKIAVQPFEAGEDVIIVELYELKAFNSEEEKKKNKSLKAIANILNKDVESKEVQDIYYAVKRGEIQI